MIITLSRHIFKVGLYVLLVFVSGCQEEEQTPFVAIILPEVSDMVYGSNVSYEIKAVIKTPYTSDIQFQIAQEDGETDSSDYSVSSRAMTILAGSLEAKSTVTLKGKTIRDHDKVLLLRIESTRKGIAPQTLTIKLKASPGCLTVKNGASYFDGIFYCLGQTSYYQTKFILTQEENVIMENNAWDSGLKLYYKLDPSTRTVAIIKNRGDQVFTVSTNTVLYFDASGTYSLCDGEFALKIEYNVKDANGAFWDNSRLVYLK